MQIFISLGWIFILVFNLRILTIIFKITIVLDYMDDYFFVRFLC